MKNPLATFSHSNHASNHHMNNTTDSVSQLNASFVTALGELRNVAKNAVNPHFRNRYASLDAILDDVRPILAANNLGISQEPLFLDGKAGVVTRIIHASGESRESTLPLPIKDQTAQGVGSALTYAKRYAISSILGITADDDDDGELASKPVVQKPVIKVEAPKAKQEKLAVSVTELVEASMKAAEAQDPLTTLASMMWDADMDDAHVIEFLIAKKAIKDRTVLLKDVKPKVINRLIEVWDDVLAFKPAL